MRRQAALSIRVASVFIAILVALPLVNLYLPDLAGTEVMGFSLTWLILAVLFYPLTWLLSSYFVRSSETLEADLVKVTRDTWGEGGMGMAVSAPSGPAPRAPGNMNEGGTE